MRMSRVSLWCPGNPPPHHLVQSRAFRHQPHSCMGSGHEGVIQRGVYFLLWFHSLFFLDTRLNLTSGLELDSLIKARQLQRSIQLMFLVQVQFMLLFSTLPQVYQGQEVQVMTAAAQ